MATLLEIPTEIILEIAELLDPKSIFSFALSCKAHHIILNPTLALCAKYHTIDTTPPTDASQERDPLLIWNTLEEILKDPRKGKYVRMLRISGDRRIHYDSAGSTCGLPSALPPENQILFKEAIHALSSLYPALWSDDYEDEDFPDEWSDFVALLEKRMKDGFDDAIISTLIHHLPLLETIVVTDAETWCLQYMLQWIAVSYKDPSRSPQLPFQNLKSAITFYSGDEGCCSANWACFFLSIPSLRRFTAWNIGDEISSGAAIAYRGKDTSYTSNVTDLQFTESCLAMSALEEILDGAQSLRSLRYTEGGELESGNLLNAGGELYNPKRIIGAAQHSVGHCLELLVLKQHWFDPINNDDFRRISLRGFKKLKLLICEWHMLAPNLNADPGSEAPDSQDEEEMPDEFNIKDILPESLEELRMSGISKDEDWDSLIVQLTTYSAATPNLTKFRIERTNPPLVFDEKTASANF